jgi:hypothetical protein
MIEVFCYSPADRRASTMFALDFEGQQRSTGEILANDLVFPPPQDGVSRPPYT